MYKRIENELLELFYTSTSAIYENWSEPVLIDSCTVVSSVIESSPVDDKVCLAYAKPSNLQSQWHSDIVYFTKVIYLDWDWENGEINLTDYATDNDSLWAFKDIDILYDYEGSLHFCWGAQWVVEDRIHWRTFVFYENISSNEIIATHAYPGESFEDICGDWNRPVTNLNLGYIQGDYDDYIFTTWIQYDPQDVSANGYGNGDIFFSQYPDGYYDLFSSLGSLTNTRTPACLPGDCLSEYSYSIVDDLNNDYDITYIIDKDPGSIPFSEGSATLNSSCDEGIFYPFWWGDAGNAYVRVVNDATDEPIDSALIEVFNPYPYELIYSTYTQENGRPHYQPVPPIGYKDFKASKPGYTSDIRYGVMIEWEGSHFIELRLGTQTGIDDDSPLPRELSLSQNYPNPFNQTTTISFDLPGPEQVSLEIYDITGAQVETLIESYLPAGAHKINWNANKLASGTYIYKLKAGEQTQVNKAVLIK